MDNYRIRRVDSRNIAIQEYKGDKKPRWESISYHGNSPSSLASGLLELIMAQHSPEQKELLGQLKSLELAIVSGSDKIRKMIDEIK